MKTPRKNRRVIISDDYLDGAIGLSVRKPADYDEYAIVVPAELLARLDAANTTLRAIEEELREYLHTGRRARNPKYVADEGTE